jgi:hypothetical protein
LRNITFTQRVGDAPTSILSDPDNGGFDVSVRSVQINPEGNTGVGNMTIRSGPDTVVFDNTGTITVNGQRAGNIKDPGFVGPITLPGGGVVSTSTQIDGPNGQTAERFTIRTGEYTVTAALREPSGATPYLDINFEEMTATAANNATGRDEVVSGVTENGQPVRLGIDDLLRIEPDTPLLRRLQGN